MFTPQLKIRVLNVLKDADKPLTVKELSNILKVGSHTISQQLHSYKLQGLIRTTQNPKVNALRYEITQKGISVMAKPASAINSKVI